jgi:site-specific DNA-methyltransferase (adenine-specific)
MSDPQIRVLEGDCLARMKEIESASVDLILTDLPYGTTYAPWDSKIPIDELWKAWLRIAKPRTPIVLTASQPFTSSLVMSNPRMFRCEWIWDKVNAANFANAKRQPMKTHENVLVFSKQGSVYNPQKIPGPKNNPQGPASRKRNCETQRIAARAPDDLSGMKYPKSIQTFPKHSSQLRLHSTQKPVELFDYLVRTYSNEGDLVLDCAAGSGTTGAAALRLNRRAILIDNDPTCIATMNHRLGLAPATRSTL